MEIKAGNASHIGNEFGQVSVNPSMALNTEGKVGFVAGANVEDINGCGVGFLEYRHVSPSFSPANCELNWPVCRKYPECAICTTDIEEPLTQRVSDEVLLHFPPAFYYELLEFSSSVRCDRSSKQTSSGQFKMKNTTTMIPCKRISLRELAFTQLINAFLQFTSFVRIATDNAFLSNNRLCGPSVYLTSFFLIMSETTTGIY